MRVISGKYKGKKIMGFDIDGTRPTMDRVKESLFAMIQTKVKDSTVLDLFAGSGSLGIEALSNGAREAYFIDNNTKIIQILKNNTSFIDEDIHILKSDYIDALRLLKEYQFDIIFLDPPYNAHLINNCLEKIHEYDLLSPSGIIVCEYEDEEIVTDYFDLIKEKKYSDKHIKIYKCKV